MGWLSDKVAKSVEAGNPATAKAVELASRAASVVHEARHGTTPPEGGYATFTDSGDAKSKKGLFRRG